MRVRQRGVEFKTRLAGKFFAGMKSLLVQLSSWTGEFPPCGASVPRFADRQKGSRLRIFHRAGKNLGFELWVCRSNPIVFPSRENSQKASTSQVSLGWKRNVTWDLLLTLSTPRKRG